MTAYYNENDPKAAAWLRELIKEGHIAHGEVDERSILDVTPADLAGYSQCHFFAGIGGWSYALRLAGWPDDRPVWTGSCPCQPFSAAGKRAGFADERHLWPAWFHLIRECRPQRVFGEQVANAFTWLDLVSSDLEGEGYAIGAAIVGAHSVGAPHIRQRFYWVAVTEHAEWWPVNVHGKDGRDGSHVRREETHSESGTRSQVRGVADDDDERSHGRGARSAGRIQPANSGNVGDAPSTRPFYSAQSGIHSGEKGRGPRDGEPERPGAASDMGDAESIYGQVQLQPRRPQQTRAELGGPSATSDGLEHAKSDGRQQRRSESSERGVVGGRGENCGNVGNADEPGPQRRRERRDGRDERAPWAASVVIPCTDGKTRIGPIEPEFQPLADGVPGRVGLLRGYGNAIVPQVAAAFIEASEMV